MRSVAVILKGEYPKGLGQGGLVPQKCGQNCIKTDDNLYTKTKLVPFTP